MRRWSLVLFLLVSLELISKTEEMGLLQNSHLLPKDSEKSPTSQALGDCADQASELNGVHGCLTLDSTQPSTSLRQLKIKQTQTLFTVSNT